MARMIRFTKAAARPRKPKQPAGKKDILAKLDSFLKQAEPETVEFLVSGLQETGNAVTYKELREAYLSGGMTQYQFEKWQKEYSKLVDSVLRPKWEQEAEIAAQEVKDQYPLFVYEPSKSEAVSWIRDHGAELVTNLAQDQIDALNAMIGHFSGYTAITPDEAARQMRPCIGLTKPQAIANLRYREAVKAAYMEQHPKGPAAVAEKKAAEAAARYAGRQHRYRAQSIARTELAFGYNAGAYGATKDAQAQGYIGACRKKWLTAYDERVCPICSAMDEETVDMDAMFSNGKLLPPGHPMCRCAVAYEEISPPMQAANSGGAFNFGNSLEGYTDTQKGEITQLLGNAPQEIQDAFARYGGQFQEADSYIDPAIGRAYFNPADGRVHMHRQDAAAGSSYEARYQTHFHEYAHNLDYLAGNGNNASLAWRSQNGEMLEDIIEKDWDNSLKSFFLSDAQHGYSQNLEPQLSNGGMGGEQYLRDVLYAWRKINRLSRFDSSYLALKNELNSLSGTKRSCRQYWEKHFDTFKDTVYNNYIDKKDVLDMFIADIDSTLSEIEKFDISDMFQRYAIKTGGTNYAESLGYGHKEGYALSRGNLTIEAFAEMTAASIASPDSLAQIKKHLPNAYNAYLEILKGMV